MRATGRSSYVIIPSLEIYRFEFPTLPPIGSALFSHLGTRQTHHPGEPIKYAARPANIRGPHMPVCAPPLDSYRHIRPRKLTGLCLLEAECQQPGMKSIHAFHMRSVSNFRSRAIGNCRPRNQQRNKKSSNTGVLVRGLKKEWFGQHPIFVHLLVSSHPLFRLLGAPRGYDF